MSQWRVHLSHLGKRLTMPRLTMRMMNCRIKLVKVLTRTPHIIGNQLNCLMYGYIYCLPYAFKFTFGST
jgi:hypothetical protein